MTEEPLKISDTLRGLKCCPHCGVANPEMTRLWRSDCIVLPEESYGYNWATYKCTSCYDLVLIRSLRGSQSTLQVKDIYPEIQIVAEELPPRARRYLEQAVRSIHTPDGAAMLAGSAVDAMLKEKELTEGSVYDRIDKAVEQNILTRDMADWAHEVRLGSNRPRHSDDKDPHVSSEDAKRSIDFAKTLGHVLFVLPMLVKRGRREPQEATDQATC